MRAQTEPPSRSEYPEPVFGQALKTNRVPV
jgi:hypothetical protein